MPKPATPPLTTGQQNEVVSLYLDGLSIKQLARRFRCRTMVISALLSDRAVRLHPGGRTHPRLSPTQEREMADAYESGESLQELTDRYEVSKTTVRNVLRRQGIQSRDPGRIEFWSTERLHQLRTLHDEGHSERVIGERLGISGSAVGTRLRILGIAGPKERARGAAHGAWKGGRSKSEGGYVLLLCSKDDAKFVTPNASGYALEHRLVVGRFLGRRLLPSETVHHINGDKTDNRIENLQIRQGKHGAGVAYECSVCGSRDVVAVPLAE